MFKNSEHMIAGGADELFGSPSKAGSDTTQQSTPRGSLFEDEDSEEKLFSPSESKKKMQKGKSWI